MSALREASSSGASPETAKDGGGAAASESAAFDFRPVACGACGADQPKHLGWRGGDAHQNGAGVRTRVVRCGVCTHVYPNPMPFPARGLDELYTNPEEYFHGQDVEAKKPVALELLRTIERTLGRRGRYLDVACGQGENLWAARELGWEYEGVDASSAYLASGEKYLGVRGRLGTLEEVGFPNDYFDAITMNAIIEHLYDPYTTMREVRRVLKPDGLVWFNAPNEDALYQRVGNFYMRAQGRDWVVALAPTFAPFHVQGFNPRSLRALLDRVGLEIESFKSRGGIWPQKGEQSLRKRLEYQAARLIDWVDTNVGSGSYLYVVARKKKGTGEK